MPSLASCTGMSLNRAISSSIKLRKSGDRCWTMTNAIPVSVGSSENRCSSDSRPPADAPIPTMREGPVGASTSIGTRPAARSAPNADGSGSRLPTRPCRYRTVAVGTVSRARPLESHGAAGAGARSAEVGFLVGLAAPFIGGDPVCLELLPEALPRQVQDLRRACAVAADGPQDPHEVRPLEALRDGIE